MKRIEVRFHDHEISRLSDEAAELGITRSQLIRDRCLGTSTAVHAQKAKLETKRSTATKKPQFDSQTYSKAVESAAQAVGGIPRYQIEHLVARVITSIAA